MTTESSSLTATAWVNRSDFRIAGVKISAGIPRPIKIAAATSSVRKPGAGTLPRSRRSLLCREDVGTPCITRVVSAEIYDRNAHAVAFYSYSKRIMQVTVPRDSAQDLQAKCSTEEFDRPIPQSITAVPILIPAPRDVRLLVKICDSRSIGATVNSHSTPEARDAFVDSLLTRCHQHRPLRRGSRKTIAPPRQSANEGLDFGCSQRNCSGAAARSVYF